MDSTPTEQILSAIAEMRRETAEMRQETRVGFAGLQTEVGSLRSEVGSLRSEVDGLRSEVGSLHAQVGRLEAEVASVKVDAHATRSAIMDRIDRVQNTIDQLRSEMTVNWAMADTAIKKARGNQDEVREVYDLVSSMQRQIRLLAARVDGLESRGSASG